MNTVFNATVPEVIFSSDEESLVEGRTGDERITLNTLNCELTLGLRNAVNPPGASIGE
jgi:hypothetical protein